jgi:hypothetical protein
MAAPAISEKQVIDLIDQLPACAQENVFRALLKRRWSKWEELSRDGEDRLRAAAEERNRNWDAMDEEEREEFINDMLHEDRACK